jgi:hypothetical protein
MNRKGHGSAPQGHIRPRRKLLISIPLHKREHRKRLHPMVPLPTNGWHPGLHSVGAETLARALIAAPVCLV